MMKMNPVVWFEIYVDDMDRAQKFYESVLAVELSDLPVPSTDLGELKMMAFPSEMEAGGAAGSLVKMKDMEAGKNSTIVYFGSEDCAVEEARVVAAGGAVIRPKMSIGEYGFMVLCTDTEGNRIGIHSMK